LKALYSNTFKGDPKFVKFYIYYEYWITLKSLYSNGSDFMSPGGKVVNSPMNVCLYVQV